MVKTLLPGCGGCLSRKQSGDGRTPPAAASAPQSSLSPSALPGNWASSRRVVTDSADLESRRAHAAFAAAALPPTNKKVYAEKRHQLARTHAPRLSY